MTMIDSQWLFCSAATVTSTGDSTNIVDLVNPRDMGIGDDPALKLMIYVTTAYTTTDAGTLVVKVDGSTDNSTYSIYAESRAYVAADMIAGAKLFPIDLPHRGPGEALPRYYKLVFTVTNHFTAGALTAAFVLDRNDYPAYPAGVTVAN